MIHLSDMVISYSLIGNNRNTPFILRLCGDREITGFGYMCGVLLRHLRYPNRPGPKITMPP